jgi:hypothetical protein
VTPDLVPYGGSLNTMMCKTGAPVGCKRCVAPDLMPYEGESIQGRTHSMRNRCANSCKRCLAPDRPDAIWWVADDGVEEGGGPEVAHVQRVV